MKINKIIYTVLNSRFLNEVFRDRNRIYFITGFFVIFFLIIVQKLFSYTVLNYSFYKNLADNQQIGEVIVPVTRGTILSSTNSGTVLGTSLNLYDLAIDPKMEGDIEKLEKFLREVLYKQLCYISNKNECYKNLLKLLKVLEIEKFEKDEKYIKGLISDFLKKKLSKNKVSSVFIDEELNNEQIEKIVSFGLVGVYPSGSFLYINPEEIINPEKVSEKLSIITGIEKERLMYLIRKRDLRYIPIINKLSISVSEYVNDYLKEESEIYKKGLIDKKDTIGGFIILTPMPNRYYPEKGIASSIIGFVNNDGKGYYGIEGYFNDILKGNNGKITSKKDVRGRIINAINLGKQDFFSEGVTIHTTIDRNVQKKVELILEKGVNEYRANKGTIVVIEPKTGKIISIANYPSYDLNNYSDIYDLEKVRYSKYSDPKTDLIGMPVFVEDLEKGDRFIYDSKEIFLRLASREELGDNILVKYKYKNDFGAQVYKNDAISFLYEPGSIMKAITVAIGFDTGEIDLNSMYLDEGEISIDNFKIKNVSSKCLGYNSFAHALNYSCNVGMIRIAQKIGKVLFYQYLNDFGFSEITGISLYGEVTSTINSWERWSRAQLFTSSYGLGVSVTPLQMANAYSILANGGVYIRPRIIDFIEFPDGKVIKYKKEEERRVIKKSTSEIITSMLVDSAAKGVASLGNVEGFSVAGKTGTSQIPYKGGYETGIGSTIGSYAGYGPAEDPQFVIIVKLDRPRTSEYGGSTSSHLFRETAEYLFDYYGIPKRKIESKKDNDVNEIE